MSSKNNGVNYSKLSNVQSRRRTALSTLKTILEGGSKVSKDGKSKLPLSDKDKVRINKEIETLKIRLN